MRPGVLVIAVSLCALASPARADTCVGWAIPGAVVGTALGFGAVAGGYALAGASIGNGAKDVALISGGESLGLVLGPMATCAAFGTERHVFPTASFVLTGAVLGTAAVGIPLFLVLDRRGGIVKKGEFFVPFDPMIVAMTMAAGMVGGGYAGYRFERWLREADEGKAVLVVPTGTGLALAGRFD